jgi:hypothetical protein
MPITIQFTSSDGATDQIEVHDFGDTPQKQDQNLNRLTNWAKSVYLNDDGTEPGANAARSRLAKGTVQSWRDAMKDYEHQADIAAVPPPEDIDV